MRSIFLHPFAKIYDCIYVYCVLGVHRSERITWCILPYYLQNAKYNKLLVQCQQQKCPRLGHLCALAIYFQCTYTQILILLHVFSDVYTIFAEASIHRAQFHSLCHFLFSLLFHSLPHVTVHTNTRHTPTNCLIFLF